MKRIWLSLFSALLAGVSLAAETPVTATTTPAPTGQSVLETQATAKPGKLLGGVELRPSYRGQTGAFHTENWAQLGYQFPSGLQLLYRQEFTSNLYNPQATPATEGLNLSALDGSLRAKVGDIWKAGATSLNYEARVYLPTEAPKRDAGMITAVRNYFRLKQNLSQSVAVILEEVPIVHFYSQAGFTSRRGAEANRAFENRVYLDLDVKLPIAGMKLFVPVMLASSRHRDFAPNARFNDSWSHKVTLYPEVTYALNANTTLGLAYYTDNLIQPDFSGFTLRDGFSRGVTQLILSASL